jgi:chromatin structure-remodeling complex protein RSC7
VAQRKACWEGVYDTHTNAMHYPRITQPTHARWEPVLDDETDSVEKAITNGHTADHNQPDSQPHSGATIFDKVSTIVARNFMVTDTFFESPALNGAGIPGVDGAVLDVGPNGLPAVTPEMLELLPVECREALVREKEKETDWKTRWTSEVENGMRGQLRIAFLGWPQ